MKPYNTDSSDIILTCDSVCKSFQNTHALSNVTLTLNRGKIIGLLGANGSGKSTLLKLINGLLVPDKGEIMIGGHTPGVETKKIVSYLPDATYLSSYMTAEQIIDFFADFYSDFDSKKAFDMLKLLNLRPEMKMKSMSKGMKEKLQLLLVMSRNALLYCLDEPIGGVDPATRDYILSTIITNYSEDATVLISTHLISEIEMILDEAIFLNNGTVMLHESADSIRNDNHMTIDSYFREVFRCIPNY